MSGGGSRLRALAMLASVVFAAMACGENEASSAEAARADSSAAGYTVGPRPATVAMAADSARDTTPAAAQPVQVQRPPVSSGPTTAAALPNVSRPVVPPADTARKVATVTKTPPPNVTTVNPKVDSVRTPAVPAGPVRVNEFLTYDMRSQTVSLQLIAGYNGLNGSLNYNGATSGSHGISVPLGWRIHVAVVNRDSDLQHSAIVLREVLPPPIEPSEPAFSGAALPDLGEGLQEDDTGTLDFVADHPGQFMIACGVPGHAQAGMWLKLAVTKGLAAPIYR